MASTKSIKTSPRASGRRTRPIAEMSPVDRLDRIVSAIQSSSTDEQNVTVDALEKVVDLRRMAASTGRDDSIFESLILTSLRLLEDFQPRGSALTRDRAAYIVSSGAYTAEQLASAEREVSAGALSRLQQTDALGAVSSSYGTAEVGRMLGIDASRVRGRQSKGLLYSFLVGTQRRYPSWQFAGADSLPMPHLAALVDFFATRAVNHATVGAFMTTPQEDLVIDPSTKSLGAPMTPVQWLTSGNDPQMVFDLFESYLVA